LACGAKGRAFESRRVYQFVIQSVVYSINCVIIKPLSKKLVVILLDKASIKQYLLPLLKSWLYPALSLLLVIGFGTWFVFSIPPFQVPDEQGHFARAYGISEGRYVIQKSLNGRFGYRLPESVMSFMLSYDSKLDTGNRNVSALNQHFKSVNFSDIKDQPTKEFDFENIALYSPINYVPQSFGLNVAKALNLSIYDGFNLARFCALMFFAIIVMASYALLPRRAWPLLFVLSALPSVVQQAASFSADSFTNSVMLLFMAVMVRYGVSKRREFDNWPAIAWVGATSLLLAFCKPVYVVFSLLSFVFIGRQIIKKPILRYGVLAVIFIAAIGLAAWWNQQVAAIGLHYAVIQGRYDVQPEAQLAYILQMPFSYMNTLINTYLYDPVTNSVWLGGVIGKLGTRGPFLPVSFQILAYLAIVVALLRTIKRGDNAEKQPLSGSLRTWQIIVTALISLLVLFIVTTVLYLSYTALTQDYVTGLQGRYFIPIALLLLCLPVWRKIPKLSINVRQQQLFIISVAIINLSLMAYAAGAYFMI
jgi:uncharacterized membrane protein